MRSSNPCDPFPAGKYPPDRVHAAIDMELIEMGS
jgi:hypothetical protein